MTLDESIPILEALSTEWSIANKRKKILMQKQGNEICFDHHYKTERGMAMGCQTVPRSCTKKGEQSAMTTVEKGKIMNINNSHSLLGHLALDSTERTAHYYGMELKGIVNPCKDCALSKNRQTNLSKTTEVRSKIWIFLPPNKRVLEVLNFWLL